MIFRQLFESDSSTFTYLIGDSDTGEAILIDPVLETFERDLQLLKDLCLRLTATMETHVHADHLTGAQQLKDLTKYKTAYPAMVQSSCIDIGIKEGEVLKLILYSHLVIPIIIIHILSTLQYKKYYSRVTPY